jgi:hypothetical protein
MAAGSTGTCARRVYAVTPRSRLKRRAKKVCPTLLPRSANVEMLNANIRVKCLLLGEFCVNARGRRRCHHDPSSYAMPDELGPGEIWGRGYKSVGRGAGPANGSAKMVYYWLKRLGFT